MKRLSTFFNEMVRHQKRWYGQWHTWMGIFAGSILFIVSFTGALLVFEDELDMWFYPQLFDFEENNELMPLHEVFHKVRADHPQIDLFTIYHWQTLNNAYIMNFEKNHEYYQAIVNPFTGKVTGTRIYQKTIMGFIKHLHRTLLIPEIGRYIVGIASLFMVILMITGLRLWIPRHWKMLKERLTVRRGASFKRQNYDLHNTLGFYFSPFITLISITGVAITFSNLVILTLFIVNFQSPQSIGDILGKQSTYQTNLAGIPIEKILFRAQADMPHAEIRGFQIPRDSVGAYTVNFVAESEAKTGDHSFATYDQYTGDKLLNTETDFANTGKIPLNWLTTVHYGSFGGMSTRIIALLASLVAPMLFVSGFIIWYSRWKKRKGTRDMKVSLPKKIIQPKITKVKPNIN
ncbi:MAG: PepSY-associated TM helix domain-containing protein [Cyclobacteriaceae bacterium]